MLRILPSIVSPASLNDVPAEVFVVLPGQSSNNPSCGSSAIRYVHSVVIAHRLPNLFSEQPLPIVLEKDLDHHALLLERGYFYEVEDELRVTSLEEQR